ncbi:MAG: tyrosine-type recombinase/integrase [Ignavibacteria bacterium]|nr:tyrosine-type recombinase/integrase [Ignavibacteria bacterium]
MKTYKDFAYALQCFFEDYLVKECGSSNNTIRSYRDTFVLFLDFMHKKHKTNPDNIKFEMIDKILILEFLEWIQNTRNCCNNTRNQRYASIRSFFNYMLYIDPVHILQWKNICSIRIKTQEKDTCKYLTVEGIKHLIEQINVKTIRGRRDLTILSLVYYSGARVQELIDLTPFSLRKIKPYYVEFLGKGSKKRNVPIEETMMKLLESYMNEHNLNQPGMEHHPLFFNAWGSKLTNPGITYILRKYAMEANKMNPELVPKEISPHVLRHSRAMHLLQSGVNLVYIRDILGHVSIQTTEIYARADSKLKRIALEKAYEDIGIKEPKIKSWEKNPKIKLYLQGLC